MVGGPNLCCGFKVCGVFVILCFYLCFDEGRGEDVKVCVLCFCFGACCGCWLHQF